MARVEIKLAASDKREGLTLGDLYQWLQAELGNGADPRTPLRATVGFRQQLLALALRSDRRGGASS